MSIGFTFKEYHVGPDSRELPFIQGRILCHSSGKSFRKNGYLGSFIRKNWKIPKIIGQKFHNPWQNIHPAIFREIFSLQPGGML